MTRLFTPIRRKGPTNPGATIGNPRKTLILTTQTRGQNPGRQRRIHNSLPPKNLCKVFRRKRLNHGEVPGARHEPTKFISASIRCVNNHDSTTLCDPFPHLHKTAYGLPGTPCQPKKFHHPPVQTCLYLSRQILRHRNLTPRSPCEHTAFAGLFYHIPPGAQPYSPTGKASVQIRHHHTRG
ncbi:hypothetical protein AA14362_2341 [Acetobacter cerevisiae DSM 14362]|nr:hypothetical protein AA14362_2341 [Acetobacter cerevisiae DSM 14362]